MRAPSTWLGIALAVAIAIATSPGRVHADEASEARLQYELGVEMYRQRRYPEALERFLASNRLVPNANVAFNIAQTYGLMSRAVDAYNWYETYLTSFELAESERRDGLVARDALAPRVGILDVRTDPAGASLYVDRVNLGSIGRGPRRIAVTPGAHRVIAQREGRREAASDATAELGRVVEIAISLPPIIGTLVVESTPAGALVRVRGQSEPLGTTPVRAELPVGEAQLTVTLPGHIEQTRTVTIRDAAIESITVPLLRAASEVAVLSVVTVPSGAEVRLDGQALGRAPLTRDSLSPGRHRLELTAPGREPWATDVLLEAGGATRARATLVGPDDKPWTGFRWLGLGVGGALVVGGAITAGVAASNRAAFFDAPEANPTRAQYDAVATANLVADVLLVSGIVVLAATVVWELLTPPAPVSRGQLRTDR